MVVIQLIILGLVATEWCAKAYESEINTDKLSVAAANLFYAYDVYDFFVKQQCTDEVCIKPIRRFLLEMRWGDMWWDEMGWDEVWYKRS